MWEMSIQDYMRGGGGGQVTIRFDPEDVLEVPCHCEYDPALSNKKHGNRVRVLRKVEVRKPYGSWKPYPSYTWVDADGGPYTKVMVMLTGEKAVSIMTSTVGVPDGKLGVALREAGVYSGSVDAQTDY